MTETHTCEACNATLIEAEADERVVTGTRAVEVWPGGRYRCRDCI